MNPQPLSQERSRSDSGQGYHKLLKIKIMTSTYISFGDTEEEIYRSKLYDLADKYNHWESVDVWINSNDLKAICRSEKIKMPKVNKDETISLGYWLRGWGDFGNERSDAIVISHPVVNINGYAGEIPLLINKISAKFVYNFIRCNYKHIGGAFRRVTK